MPEDIDFSKQSLEQGQTIPFNKPVDWTSFDVVNKLRHITHVKKVGHAGTLDPFATGLLLICFGKATKVVEKLIGLPKEYICTLKFGEETDTLDPTGKVISAKPVSLPLDGERIRSVLSGYVGKIQQVPPMFSAIKRKGQRLYELARKGEVIERAPRTVEIYDISFLEMQAATITVKVSCAKGTYIRALARDIGRELGWGAHLTSLIRTRIGYYSLENAWDLKSFEKKYIAYNNLNECTQRSGKYQTQPG